MAFNAFLCSLVPRRFQEIPKFINPDSAAAKIDGSIMAAAPPSRVNAMKVITNIATAATSSFAHRASSQAV